MHARRFVAAAIALLLAGPAIPDARGAAVDVATVYRDPFGVPSIEAPSQNAMAYAMGFSLAQDRPFQLDLFRRAGSGRLSEVLGEGSDDDNDGTGDYLQSDILMRQEFFDVPRMQAQIDAWDPELRSLWESYGRGITTGWAEIVANPATHPIEFQASGYEPEPWTTLDSLAVTVLFTILDNGAWGGSGELDNATFLGQLRGRFPSGEGDAIWQDIVWMNDPDANPVIPDADAPPRPDGLGEVPDSPHPAQLQATNLSVPANAAHAQQDLLGRIVNELPLPKLGSYAVAVSGEASESGNSMFVGAPQSGLSAPPVVWEVGLHAPGISCAGAAVPGAGPFLVLGRCAGHAWSIVAGVAGDQVDVVVESLSGAGYIYDDEVEAFERRTEVFTVRSTNPSGEPQFTSVEREFLRSRHGPLFATDGDKGYVRKRSQDGRVIDNLTSLFRMTTAQDIDEAEDAAQEGSWSVHIVYADDDGNVAYWFTGLNPVHAPGLDPRLPTPGHSSAFEWARILPKDDNPHVRNPQQGFLVANQGLDSIPVSWWPASDDWRMGRVERKTVTEKIVADLVPIDPDDLERINRLACCDIDPLVGFFADVAREAVSMHPTPARENAIAALDAWAAAGYARVDNDGDGFYDAPGIAMWAADDMPRDVYDGTLGPGPVWSRLYSLIYQDELGGRPAIYGLQDQFQYIDRSLRHVREIPTALVPAVDYFDNIGTSGVTETWDQLVIQAIDEGMGALGAPAAVNATPVRTLGALDVRDAMVFDHASYNFLVDFGSSSGGLSILAPGQGSPVSAADFAAYSFDETYPDHYVDQHDMYERFEFKPLRLFASEYQDAADPQRLHAVAGPVANAAPRATSDHATTDEHKTVTIDVLANDHDPDGDPLTTTRVTDPPHGVAQVKAGGSVNYTPDINFDGTDSFDYTIADGKGGTDSATVTITVNNVPVPRTLDVSKSGDGTGRVASSPAGIDCGATCAHTFPEGTTVTLSATADTHATFAGWSGACTNSSGDCVVSMTKRRNVTATFTANKRSLLVSTAGDGSVTSTPAGIACGSDCGHTYDEGTPVTLSASPGQHSDFSEWSGACTNNAGDCVLSMDTDHTVTASFATRRHTLSVSKQGDGTGSVTSDPAGVECGSDCSENYDEGTSVRLSAVPSLGSVFSGWSGACTNTSGDCVVSIESARSATATFDIPARPPRIVFATDRYGDYEIASMERDGTGLARLTHSGAKDTVPATSPDGSKIAFVSHRDGNAEIYVMDTDGSDQTRITKNRSVDKDPAWSPDGSKIIFATSRYGNYEIASMRSDGTTVRRLTRNRSADAAPAVSPDGTKIVLTSHSRGGSDLYVMNVDGSGRRRLTKDRARDDQATWTPDGKRIVFTTDRDGNEEIASIDVDGRDFTRLTSDEGADASPAVSPDGTEIAFTSERNGNLEIYLMAIDESGITRITRDPGDDVHPEWIRQ